MSIHSMVFGVYRFLTRSTFERHVSKAIAWVATESTYVSDVRKDILLLREDVVLARGANSARDMKRALSDFKFVGRSERRAAKETFYVERTLKELEKNVPLAQRKDIVQLYNRIRAEARSVVKEASLREGGIRVRLEQLKTMFREGNIEKTQFALDALTKEIDDVLQWLAALTIDLREAYRISPFTSPEPLSSRQYFFEVSVRDGQKIRLTIVWNALRTKLDPRADDPYPWLFRYAGLHKLPLGSALDILNQRIVDAIPLIFGSRQLEHLLGSSFRKPIMVYVTDPQGERSGLPSGAGGYIPFWSNKLIKNQKAFCFLWPSPSDIRIAITVGMFSHTSNAIASLITHELTHSLDPKFSILPAESLSEDAGHLHIYLSKIRSEGLAEFSQVIHDPKFIDHRYGAIISLLKSPVKDIAADYSRDQFSPHKLGLTMFIQILLEQIHRIDALHSLPALRLLFADDTTHKIAVQLVSLGRNMKSEQFFEYYFRKVQPSIYDLSLREYISRAYAIRAAPRL